MKAQRKGAWAGGGRRGTGASLLGPRLQGFVRVFVAAGLEQAMNYDVRCQNGQDLSFPNMNALLNSYLTGSNPSLLSPASPSQL